MTFGLLVSHDRGKTFDWVCEQSIGFSGIEDPMYAITPSKTYVGTTFRGLTVTRDRGCGWSFAGGELAEQVFIDLSQNPIDARNIVVFSSSYDKEDGDGGLLFSTKIWETKDEARTFQQLGQPLDPGLFGNTLDLTATDPDRIYVTAVTAVREPGARPKAFLLTSKNHGRTWDEQQVPLEGSERAVFIAAVDPTDPERVYLRTSNTADMPTRLLLREAGAGGVSMLRTLHNASGPLLGFALSPDGTKVYIGGPKDGVKVARTDDFAFTQRARIETQCLAVNAQGLWACSSERSGFIAGLSTDDGATFQPRLRFCEIRGPLACGAGTPTTDRCVGQWPLQRALLGCRDGDGSLRPEGGLGDGDGVRPAPSPGCGCNASPAAPWGALAAVAFAALALLRRSRWWGR